MTGCCGLGLQPLTAFSARAKSYASRLLPSATDTTELVITQNNGTDTSNRLKKNEEFGHDERRKTKKAINDDT